LVLPNKNWLIKIMMIVIMDERNALVKVEKNSLKRNTSAKNKTM
jgi:hypothetical protein